MEIRLIKKSEFKDLLKLMNLSFGFTTRDSKFEFLLPKLYTKFKSTDVHLGVFDNNTLVASLGLYPQIVSSKYKDLNLVYVGGVSTHPKYRNKGYFTLLMKEAINYAKKSNYDLMFLGGNRTRYNHFGFECAGSKFVFHLDGRKPIEINNIKYSIKPMDNAISNDINECLNIYLNQPQHSNRIIANFSLILHSWLAAPYIVYVDNNVVGYFAIKKDRVLEINYYKEYQNIMLAAITSKYKNVYVYCDKNSIDENILNICDDYHIEHCGMALIFNEKNVCKYMNITSKEYLTIKDLPQLSKVSLLMGDQIKSNLSGGSFFIHNEDCC